jgi:hypothetical protein
MLNFVLKNAIYKSQNQTGPKCCFIKPNFYIES